MTIEHQASTRAMEAAIEFQLRKDRVHHPDGTFDKASRWHPSKAECQPCCKGIREPSRAWPFSLMTHCRTLRHVCNLYGVEEREARIALADIGRIETDMGLTIGMIREAIQRKPVGA